MNPSAAGWIKKHFSEFNNKIILPGYTEEAFYQKIKQTGFVYANSVSVLTYPHGTTYRLTPAEMGKINLFDSLGYTFFKWNPQADEAAFIQSANAFYNYLKTHHWFDFNIALTKANAYGQLEKIITHRIQTTQNILQKSFSNLIANAFLYLDVLIYAHFLKTQDNPLTYARSVEAIIANTIYVALTQKTKKDDQDQLILKMLEVSIRYNKIEDIVLNYEDLNYRKHRLPLESLYLLDLSCMVVYADNQLEEGEEAFIRDLSERLGFTAGKTEQCICEAKDFISCNRDKIPFLEYNNPFKNLYDNTNNTVKTLIVRNKKRLTQEIKQSKELVYLLSKSQSEKLNKEEKEKVKTQLLDICKVIPSLGIFILPGGSILLPILIKFIPNLLPSAFTDNQ